MSRDERGRYVPGTSGNPGGRPRYALANAIRRAVPVDELVEFFRDVWADVTRPMADRQWAAQQLADRGWGRPVQQVELDAAIGNVPEPSGMDFGRLTLEQKRSLMEILRQARLPPTGETNSAELHDNAGNGADEKGGQPFALPEPPTDE